jgi:hypothetical protein
MGSKSQSDEIIGSSGEGLLVPDIVEKVGISPSIAVSMK